MYYRIIIIILSIFVAGLWFGIWSLRFGSTSEAMTLGSSSTYIVSEGFFSGLQNIPAIVLAGPRSDTWSRWSQTMGKNKQYIRGRLYDLTDKKAKPWFNNISLSSGVVLIMESNKFQQFGNDFKGWQGYYSGSQVSLYSDAKLGVTYTHAKTFVGDKRRAIQTANLTHSSFAKNIEHFVLGTDDRIRQDLLTLFALDIQTISNKSKKDKKGYTDWIRNSSPNLLVCPLNCRAKMEYLISHATQSIRISAQYVKDARIMKLLEGKQSLDLRIRTNDSDDNYPLRDLLGPKVVMMQKSPYNHDKMMIIDEKILLIGSMNFSDNALDNNREIGILLTDQKVIEEVGKVFRN